MTRRLRPLLIYARLTKFIFDSPELDKFTATATRARSRLGISNGAGSRPVLRSIVPDLNIAIVRAFFHLVPSHFQLDQVLATLWDYLESALANRGAVFERGAP
jgi:hypothetical protein